MRAERLRPALSFLPGATPAQAAAWAALGRSELAALLSLAGWTLLAGWFGLAFLVIALAGPDRDGGVAMGIGYALFENAPAGEDGPGLEVGPKPHHLALAGGQGHGVAPTQSEVARQIAPHDHR